MSYIFVEVEGILGIPKNGETGNQEAIKKYHPREEVIELINALSEKYDIVAFSMTQEKNRSCIEDFLVMNDVQIDTVLLRSDYDRSAGHVARNKIILDYFNGNSDKMFLDTHSIYTNFDKFSELLMDEEYTVFQVG